MYKADVYISLKKGVLDAQGAVLLRKIEKTGTEGVEEIKVGKHIEIIFAAENEVEAEEKTNLLCEKVLVNSVIEEFRFTLTEV